MPDASRGAPPARSCGRGTRLIQPIRLHAPPLNPQPPRVIAPGHADRRGCSARAASDGASRRAPHGTDARPHDRQQQQQLQSIHHRIAMKSGKPTSPTRRGGLVPSLLRGKAKAKAAARRSGVAVAAAGPPPPVAKVHVATAKGHGRQRSADSEESRLSSLSDPEGIIAQLGRCGVPPALTEAATSRSHSSSQSAPLNPHPTSQRRPVARAVTSTVGRAIVMPPRPPTAAERAAEAAAAAAEAAAAAATVAATEDTPPSTEAPSAADRRRNVPFEQVRALLQLMARAGAGGDSVSGGSRTRSRYSRHGADTFDDGYTGTLGDAPSTLGHSSAQLDYDSRGHHTEEEDDSVARRAAQPWRPRRQPLPPSQQHRVPVDAPDVIPADIAKPEPDGATLDEMEAYDDDEEPEEDELYEGTGDSYAMSDPVPEAEPAAESDGTPAPADPTPRYTVSKIRVPVEAAAGDASADDNDAIPAPAIDASAMMAALERSLSPGNASRRSGSQRRRRKSQSPRKVVAPAAALGEAPYYANSPRVGPNRKNAKDATARKADLLAKKHRDELRTAHAFVAAPGNENALPQEIVAVTRDETISDLDQSVRHFPLREVHAQGSGDVSTLDPPPVDNGDDDTGTLSSKDDVAARRPVSAARKRTSVSPAALADSLSEDRLNLTAASEETSGRVPVEAMLPTCDRSPLSELLSVKIGQQPSWTGTEPPNDVEQMAASPLGDPCDTMSLPKALIRASLANARETPKIANIQAARPSYFFPENDVSPPQYPVDPSARHEIDEEFDAMPRRDSSGLVLLRERGAKSPDPDGRDAASAVPRIPASQSGDGDAVLVRKDDSNAYFDENGERYFVVDPSCAQESVDGRRPSKDFNVSDPLVAGSFNAHLSEILQESQEDVKLSPSDAVKSGVKAPLTGPGAVLLEEEDDDDVRTERALVVNVLDFNEDFGKRTTKMVTQAKSDTAPTAESDLYRHLGLATASNDSLDDDVTDKYATPIDTSEEKRDNPVLLVQENPQNYECQSGCDGRTILVHNLLAFGHNFLGLSPTKQEELTEKIDALSPKSKTLLEKSIEKAKGAELTKIHDASASATSSRMDTSTLSSKVGIFPADGSNIVINLDAIEEESGFDREIVSIPSHIIDLTEVASRNDDDESESKSGYEGVWMLEGPPSKNDYDPTSQRNQDGMDPLVVVKGLDMKWSPMHSGATASFDTVKMSNAKPAPLERSLSIISETQDRYAIDLTLMDDSDMLKYKAASSGEHESPTAVEPTDTPIADFFDIPCMAKSGDDISHDGADRNRYDVDTDALEIDSAPLDDIMSSPCHHDASRIFQNLHTEPGGDNGEIEILPQMSTLADEAREALGMNSTPSVIVESQDWSKDFPGTETGDEPQKAAVTNQATTKVSGKAQGSDKRTESDDELSDAGSSVAYTPAGFIDSLLCSGPFTTNNFKKHKKRQATSNTDNDMLDYICDNAEIIICGERTEIHMSSGSPRLEYVARKDLDNARSNDEEDLDRMSEATSRHQQQIPQQLSVDHASLAKTVSDNVCNDPLENIYQELGQIYNAVQLNKNQDEPCDSQTIANETTVKTGSKPRPEEGMVSNAETNKDDIELADNAVFPEAPTCNHEKSFWKKHHAPVPEDIFHQNRTNYDDLLKIREDMLKRMQANIESMTSAAVHQPPVAGPKPMFGPTPEDWLSAKDVTPVVPGKDVVVYEPIQGETGDSVNPNKVLDQVTSMGRLVFDSHQPWDSHSAAAFKINSHRSIPVVEAQLVNKITAEPSELLSYSRSDDENEVASKSHHNNVGQTVLTGAPVIPGFVATSDISVVQGTERAPSSALRNSEAASDSAHHIDAAIATQEDRLPAKDRPERVESVPFALSNGPVSASADNLSQSKTENVNIELSLVENSVGVEGASDDRNSDKPDESEQHPDLPILKDLSSTWSNIFCGGTNNPTAALMSKFNADASVPEKVPILNEKTNETASSIANKSIWEEIEETARNVAPPLSPCASSFAQTKDPIEKRLNFHEDILRRDFTAAGQSVFTDAETLSQSEIFSIGSLSQTFRNLTGIDGPNISSPKHRSKSHSKKVSDVSDKRSATADSRQSLSKPGNTSTAWDPSTIATDNKRKSTVPKEIAVNNDATGLVAHGVPLEIQVFEEEKVSVKSPASPAASDGYSSAKGNTKYRGRFGSLSGEKNLGTPPKHDVLSESSFPSDDKTRSIRSRKSFSHFLEPRNDAAIRSDDEVSLILALTRSEGETTSPTSPTHNGKACDEKDNSISRVERARALVKSPKSRSDKSDGRGEDPSKSSTVSSPKKEFCRSPRLQSVLDRLRERRKQGFASPGDGSRINEHINVEDIFSRYDNIVKQMVVLDDSRLMRVQEKQQQGTDSKTVLSSTSRRKRSSSTTPSRPKSSVSVVRRANSFSSRSETSTPSEKARNLRKQLDLALQTSAKIRNTQERLGAELTTFKSRIQQQRDVSPVASRASSHLRASPDVGPYSPGQPPSRTGSHRTQTQYSRGSSDRTAVSGGHASSQSRSCHDESEGDRRVPSLSKIKNRHDGVGESVASRSSSNNSGRNSAYNPINLVSNHPATSSENTSTRAMSPTNRRVGAAGKDPLNVALMDAEVDSSEDDAFGEIREATSSQSKNSYNSEDEVKMMHLQSILHGLQNAEERKNRAAP